VIQTIQNQPAEIPILTKKAQTLVDRFREINDFDLAVKYLLATPPPSAKVHFLYFMHLLSIADKNKFETIYFCLVLREGRYTPGQHDYARPYFEKKLGFCKTYYEVNTAYEQYCYLLQAYNNGLRA
jgi:hypothetical protein